MCDWLKGRQAERRDDRQGGGNQRLRGRKPLDSHTRRQRHGRELGTDLLGIPTHLIEPVQQRRDLEEVRSVVHAGSLCNKLLKGRRRQYIPYEDYIGATARLLHSAVSGRRLRRGRRE